MISDAVPPASGASPSSAEPCRNFTFPEGTPPPGSEGRTTAVSVTGSPYTLVIPKGVTLVTVSARNTSSCAERPAMLPSKDSLPKYCAVIW